MTENTPDPDTDPIAITHQQDPSLGEDELILHTSIDPNSVGDDVIEHEEPTE